MASLLERMNISPDSVGPVRSKSGRAGSAPYSRSPRPPPKGNIEGAWQHDLYQDNNGRSLSDRLGKSAAPPKVYASMADRALREAQGEKGLTIKGASASSRGNVVEVGGLADGTTSEDVEAIFKRCGPITWHKAIKQSPVVVRLTYKNEKDAQTAVASFNGQPADGRVLSVKVVGGANATLGGRLSAAVDDSVDVLMDDTPGGGSKLRSDDLLAQGSRATVLVAPPGADPSDYVQKPARGGRGGRGRGRGRGRRGASRMDLD